MNIVNGHATTTTTMPDAGVLVYYNPPCESEGSGGLKILTTIFKPHQRGGSNEYPKSMV